MLDHPEPRQSFAVLVAAVLSYSLRDLDTAAFGQAVEALGTSASMLLALMVIFFGLLVATLMFFVVAAAATAGGRMLGGTGTFGAVRTAMSWGLAPQVWAMIYRIPAVLFWPEAVRMLHGRGRPALEIGGDTVVFRPIDFGSPFFPHFAVFALLELAVLIWYAVVGSGTLAEAQRFSSWRGLATLSLAVVLPFVALMVVAAAAFLALRTA